MTLIVESENALKAKSHELEKNLWEIERELKKKELKKGVILHIIEPHEFSIVQSISQVSMKELELIGLKKYNKNLKELSLEREHERKNWEAKCVEL